MTSGHDHFCKALRQLLPRLWRFCLVLTKNRSAADDLTQNTCLRAIERQDQLQSDAYLDRWVFRIAQTIWLNDLRAAKIRNGTGLIPADEAELVDKQAMADTTIYLSQVLSKMMELPEAQRVTIFLVCVEGYTYQEAAEHLGVPIGTIMSRLAAAREKLSFAKDYAVGEYD